MITEYLTLSDAAKYAQAARNLAQGQGFRITHSFFDINVLESYEGGDKWLASFLPLPSWILSVVFRFLPINDATIVSTGLFTFLVLLLIIYLGVRKLYGKTEAIFATLLVASQPPLWEYALNASSDIFFTFEIVLVVFGLFLGKRLWIISLTFILLAFITRQQAIVLLLAVALFFLVKQWRISFQRGLATLMIFCCFFMGMYIVAKLDVSSTFSPLKGFYSGQISTSVSPSAYLRGTAFETMEPKEFAVKVFYNLYNFAKDPTRIATSTVWVIWLLFVSHNGKSKNYKDLKVFSVVALLLFVGAASASLPNARYVHPVLPLICMGAGVWLGRYFDAIKGVSGRLVLVTLLFVSITPTLGSFTLDRRFASRQQNQSKPQAVKVIARIMAQKTQKERLIVTNLDSWAAWYEDLTTMWFPTSTRMIDGFEDKIGYIVITDYNSHDADFALNDWGALLEIGGLEGSTLKDKYKLLYRGVIPASDVLENRAIKIVILEKT